MINRKIDEVNTAIENYRGLYKTVPGTCIHRKKELALLLKKRQVYLRALDRGIKC